MAEQQVKLTIIAKDQASGAFKTHAEALEHARKGYESLTDYMARTAKEAEETAAAQQSAGDAAEESGNQADGASGGWRNLVKGFTLATLSANAIQRAVSMATNAIKDSIGEAGDYERAIMGLNSAGAAFGHTAEQINQAIKTVTSDGLLGFNTAANALKTLLSTGMDIDDAIILMQRFKDEASFGRKETISFGQAVDNLAQAFKTESSQLGDASGHVDNFSNAIEIGAAALGKTTAQLSAAEREQAKLNGYMEQGAYTAGDAARYAETYAGSLSRMESESEKTSVSLGQMLMPVVEYTTGAFTDMLVGINESSGGMQVFQGALVSAAAIAQSVIQVFVGLGHAISGVVHAILNRDINELNRGVDRATQGFVNIWERYDAQMKEILNGGLDDGVDAHKEALDRMSQDNNAAMNQIQRQVDDATRQFQRSMESRRRSFEESLRDMIISHRDKARSIEADIARENAAYDKANLKRKQAYEDDLASLEERHFEKVQDIESQIAEERERGLVVDGVLYQIANEKKIAKLEENLRKEREAHQKALDARKAKYAEDVSEDQERHKAKITQLQKSLDEELAILNRHRADVAKIGEAVKEDDISRLKRQFAQANAEAERNHREQLARIRSQGGQLGNTFTSATSKAIKDGEDQVKDSINLNLRKAVDSGGLVIGDGGKKAADAFWRNFNQSMSRGVTNASRQVALTLKKAIESGGLEVSGSSANISGITFGVTPRATGGTVRPGETTLVGERGPEIARFPAGTQIIPADKTRQILNENTDRDRGTTVNIGTVINQSNVDADAFLSGLSWYLR